MKIAIILGNWSLSTRPLDFWFDNIWTSPRGLTGTDLSFCMISTELQKLGHQVHMFTKHAQPQHKPDAWQGCKLYNFEDRFAIIDDSFDAIISINEPDVFRGINEKPLRICWQFLNDFTYCQPGFDDFVDHWLAVCDHHLTHIKQTAPRPEKWGILPLGCDPSWYQNGKKVPGRMIFCSSADRGLHLALQAYPEIKKAIPEASLKIFYHFQEGSILNIEPNSPNQHPHVSEMSHRLRYCKNAIKKMKNMGVEHIGSVSVNDMKQEMSEASLLLYPVDTVAFTEGFSLSIMQAHAAGVIPAISAADCLNSIYRDSGCIMTDMPIKEKLEEYTSQVINALTNEKRACEIRQKCLDFSKKYLWKDIASQMVDTIENHSKNKVSLFNIKSYNKPAISIVMPTMRVGGLDVLFKSLENQTFKDFELILVDGIYKYREDVVVKEIKKYNILVKYIEPIKNNFPISCLSHSTNTAIVNASSKLMLMITDYTYLPPDCIEKHINFHAANLDENIGYMCPHQYRSLPHLHSEFPTYKNEDTEIYLEHLNVGKLNNIFWSIFENNFDQDPETLPLDDMGNADTKLFMPYGVGDQNCFNGKNESLKIEAALKVNGWDEELDGTHLCQDNVFSDLLVRKLGFKWIVDKDNKVYIINPRFVMPHARRIRPYLTNADIWNRKKLNDFADPINDWSLREMRNLIMKGFVK